MSTRRVYVDSNIFLNIWFTEMHRYSPAFYYSERLLDAILECRFFLVISDLTIMELSKKTRLSRDVIIREYLEPYRMTNKLSIIETTDEMINEARSLSRTYGLHATDALHAIVAKSEDCVVVTRDTELRIAARHIGLMAVLPEEIT